MSNFGNLTTQRLITWVATLGIVGLTLVSGPLLIGGQLMPEQSPPKYFSNASDSLNATVIDQPPDPIVFDRNGDQYKPRNSTAVIRITNLTGGPVITYRLEIPSLGYIYAAPYSTNRSLVGRDYELTVRGARIDAEPQLNRTYPATVRLLIRTGQEMRELYRANITVVLDGQ